jgi:metal-sulfur cluster biosynthetic enzyme
MMPEKIEGGPVNDPGHLNSIQRALLEGEIIESIRQIYGLNVSHEGVVDITMTLTSPACPVAGTLPGEVEQAALSTPGVKSASVELVWDPPYTIDRMPEHIRLELGLF